MTGGTSKQARAPNTCPRTWLMSPLFKYLSTVEGNPTLGPRRLAIKDTPATTGAEENAIYAARYLHSSQLALRWKTRESQEYYLQPGQGEIQSGVEVSRTEAFRSTGPLLKGHRVALLAKEDALAAKSHEIVQLGVALEDAKGMGASQAAILEERNREMARLTSSLEAEKQNSFAGGRTQHQKYLSSEGAGHQNACPVRYKSTKASWKLPARNDGSFRDDQERANENTITILYITIFCIVVFALLMVVAVRFQVLSISAPTASPASRVICFNILGLVN
uniref:Uncharacterized protein n=1 Tax=Moniliophthora roreri TaxID=221103 RepID=A0A0W0ETP9_MONRR